MKRKLFVIFPVIFVICFLVGASPLIPTLIDYYTPKETTTGSSDAGTAGTAGTANDGTAGGFAASGTAQILRVSASLPAADSTAADSTAADSTAADSTDATGTVGAAESTAADSTAEDGEETPRQVSRPAAWAALGFAGASVVFGLVILIRKSNPDR